MIINQDIKILGEQLATINRCGVRVGLDDDTEYLRGWSRVLLKRFLVAPLALREFEDPLEFKQALAARLLAEPQLEVISGWNPPFFQLILFAARLLNSTPHTPPP